jgi:hypothetical protein
MLERVKIERVRIIEKLRKWMLAFHDDVLAERGAVALYRSHIIEFGKDFKFPFINERNPLQSPNKANEAMILHAAANVLATDLGLPEVDALKILATLQHIVIGDPIIRDDPKQDSSVRHITLEEEEHEEEFLRMIEALLELISRLEKIK